jgi:hypothetical protein
MRLQSLLQYGGADDRSRLIKPDTKKIRLMKPKSNKFKEETNNGKSNEEKELVAASGSADRAITNPAKRLWLDQSRIGADRRNQHRWNQHK